MPLAFVPFLAVHLESFYQAAIAFDGTDAERPPTGGGSGGGSAQQQGAQQPPPQPPNSAQRYEPIVVLSLMFLSNVAGCRDYRPAPPGTAAAANGRLITSQGDVRPEGVRSAEGAQKVLVSILTPHRVEELVRVIVVRMMRLTELDLEEWDEDAEGYCVTQESLTKVRTHITDARR